MYTRQPAAQARAVEYAISEKMLTLARAPVVVAAKLRGARKRRLAIVKGADEGVRGLSRGTMISDSAAGVCWTGLDSQMEGSGAMWWECWVFLEF